MRLALCAAATALAVSGPAQAAVVSAWENGFRIENRATASATPEQAWTALGEIGSWWSSDHTYSGSASNMTMPLKPGGCWCEALPGGGVEHGRVVMALPERGMLRIEGSIGPLQDEGVSGALTWKVNEIPGGVEIVQTYNVGGVRPDTAKNAARFDTVLGEQLESLRAYIQPAIP
jgi:hypothetical protein